MKPSSCAIFLGMVIFLLSQFLMADQQILLIDDRSQNDLRTLSGEQWQLVTDGVMGGISEGQLLADEIDDHPCVRLRGDVSLENNGGFIQATINLSAALKKKLSEYSGLVFTVYGNDEDYNVHLRTKDLRLPWQSYRNTFHAKPGWKTLYLPFSEFTPYRVAKPLDVNDLTRIGIVAIGRKFSADLCISRIGFYK